MSREQAYLLLVRAIATRVDFGFFLQLAAALIDDPAERYRLEREYVAVNGT